jgi:hypothetical protein
MITLRSPSCSRGREAAGDGAYVEICGLACEISASLPALVSLTALTLLRQRARTVTRPLAVGVTVAVNVLPGTSVRQCDSLPPTPPSTTWKWDFNRVLNIQYGFQYIPTIQQGFQKELKIQQAGPHLVRSEPAHRLRPRHADLRHPPHGTVLCQS